MILVSVARRWNIGESQRGGCRSCDVRERRAAVSAHCMPTRIHIVSPGSTASIPARRDQVPCHCTVGLGDPDADAMNVAVLPAVTVAELGLVVIDGGTCTVSVAAALVADPATFMNTA